jgi:hypothetical protein
MGENPHHSLKNVLNLDRKFSINRNGGRKRIRLWCDLSFPGQFVMYERITPPSVSERITFKDGEPVVSDNPIVPYIRGDGTGVDI